MWEVYKKGFKTYLQLEKSLSENSVEAYIHDIEKLTQFLSIKKVEKVPKQIELSDLEEFVKWINQLGMTAASQARIVSGLRSFYKFCLQEQISEADPTTLLEAPRIGKHLPDTLSYDEIEKIISSNEQEVGSNINLSDLNIDNAENPTGVQHKIMTELNYNVFLKSSALTLGIGADYSLAATNLGKDWTVYTKLGWKF